MAIEFKTIMCRVPHNGAYLVNIAKLGDKFLIEENSEVKAEKSQPSLTNVIEYVIEHIIFGSGYKEFELYQCGHDGIFKVEWKLDKKINRAMPPWKVRNVRWTFVSRDLSTFEVLYG